MTTIKTAFPPIPIATASNVADGRQPPQRSNREIGRTPPRLS